MAGRIILVRHGQTGSNARRMIDTRPPGAELTELGRRQAELAGIELARITDGRLAAAYSSVALRAQQTLVLAAAAYERSAVRTLSLGVKVGVHEIDAGRLERVAGEEQIERYHERLVDVMSGAAGNGFPGGEDHDQVLARTRGVLEELAAEAATSGSDVALVSHGAASRFMAAAACGVDPEWAAEHRLANCRFIVMEPGEAGFGGWGLARWDTEAWPET